MLQLQRKQKTKDGQEVKHHDNFRCTITCRYCGKRRHFKAECHIKRRQSEKLKKPEGERRKNARKGEPEGAGHNPGSSPAKGSPGGGRRSSAPPLVEEEHPTPHLRVTNRVKSGLSPPFPAPASPKNLRPPKSASSSRACRLLGWM